MNTENWESVGPESVDLAYLHAEWEDRLSDRVKHRRLIDEPNLNDAAENRARLILLSQVRGRLLDELPLSTTWYKVSCLRREHLDQLRVIARVEYDEPNGKDKNELKLVAARWKHIKLINQPVQWDPPILWGHTKDGPLAILEGNHRLIGYVQAGETTELNIDCFIGLSSDGCVWHVEDKEFT